MQMILEDMMGQLMSKDVLYEPLKELNDKVSGISLVPRSISAYGLYLSIVPILSVLERGQTFGV